MGLPFLAVRGVNLSWTRGVCLPLAGAGVAPLPLRRHLPGKPGRKGLWNTGVVPIGNEKRVNWNAIRAEYIGGGISYRGLSEKHGVSFTVLKTRAKKEDWPGLRTQAEHKAAIEATQKTAIAAADNAALAANIRRMGLEIIAGLFEDYAKIRATEHRENRGGVTDIKRLRDLTAAYKDLAGDIVQGEADSTLLQSLMALERGRND